MTLEEHRRVLATREAKYSLTEKVINIFKFDFSDLVSEYKLDQVVKFDKEGNVLEERVLGSLGAGIKIVTILNKAVKAASEDSKLKKTSKAFFKELAASKNPHKVNNTSLKTLTDEYEQFILDVCEEDGRIGIACKKLGISYTSLAKKVAAKFRDNFIESWNSGSEKDHLKSFESYGVRLPKEKDAKKVEESFELLRKGRRVYEEAPKKVDPSDVTQYDDNGLEVSKNGKVIGLRHGKKAAEISNNAVKQAAINVMKKLVRDDKDTYMDVVATEDDEADIRPMMKDDGRHIVGVFADGEDEPATAYSLDQDDYKAITQYTDSKNLKDSARTSREKRIRENMKKRLSK